MNRFTPLNVTLSTLSASLYPTERILTQTDQIGLYDGKDKDPLRYDGRCYLTNHRLIYVEKEKPHLNSVYLELDRVKQTEYYSGFLKSSPKITILLRSPEEQEENEQERDQVGGGRKEVQVGKKKKLEPSGSGAVKGWICRVCGMSNVPTLELGYKCSLCGIPADPTHHSTSSKILSSSTPPIPPLPPTSTSSPTSNSTSSSSATSSSKMITCTTCTYLNHHSMSRCEMCDSPLPLPPTSSASVSVTTTPLDTPRSSTPTSNNNAEDFVRLSFRKGGVGIFYAALKEALKKREWEMNSNGSGGGKGKGRKRVDQVERDGEEGLKRNSSGVGIDAILRGIDLNTQTREDSLEDALKDLESLMSKAKEMIQLAQSLSLQSATQSQSQSQSQSQATATLSSLGLLTSAAVTSDESTSQTSYHHSLAVELASLLQPRSRTVGVVEQKGGIIGLDELWCIWNRARGIALVSPKSLKLSVIHLKLYTSPPLETLTFPSGLTILHTPHYSLPIFSHRLLQYLDQEEEEGKGLGLVEIAKKEGLSLGLGKELVELVEMQGRGLVRDSQGGGAGVRWYRDWISGWEWDGQT